MLNKSFRSISLQILHQHVYDLYVSIEIWIGTRWPKSVHYYKYVWLLNFLRDCLILYYWLITVSCVFDALALVYGKFTSSLWTPLRTWVDVVQVIVALQKPLSGQDRWSCGLVLSSVLSWKCPATDPKERISEQGKCSGMFHWNMS